MELYIIQRITKKTVLIRGKQLETDILKKSTALKFGVDSDKENVKKARPVGNANSPLDVKYHAPFHIQRNQCA